MLASIIGQFKLKSQYACQKYYSKMSKVSIILSMSTVGWIFEHYSKA